MKPLYTIGYEGSSVEDLIATLQAMEIQVLADVRELPLSRKKGLSKNKLAALLSEVGIEYIHFKALGDPKSGRDAAKSGDYAKFEAIYLAHLQTPEVQSSLDELLKVARGKKSCMMCFERSATHCHRSYIADIAANEGFVVFNLTADKAEQYMVNEAKIPRYNPRQGVPAAE